MSLTRKNCTFISLLLMTFSLPSLGLSVIQGSDNTISIEPYIAALNGDVTLQEVNLKDIDNYKPKQISNALYPVKSELTPGTFTNTNVSMPGLNHPIFVIGDDQFSIAWVKRNETKLKFLHAQGLITNVDNKNRLENIESEIGFTLQPVSLDGIEDELPITHYPFLLSRNWLEQ